MATTAYEAYIAELIGDVHKLQTLMNQALDAAETRSAEIAGTLDAAIQVYRQEVEKFTNANGMRIRAIADTEIRQQLIAARVDLQDAVRESFDRLDSSLPEAVRNAIRAEIPAIAQQTRPSWIDQLIAALAGGLVASLVVVLVLKVW